MSNIVELNSFKAFMIASRPKTLGAIICPIFLGSALAFKVSFSWGLFFLTLIAGVNLQVLANWVNDYGDFIRGADSFERLGPKRAMQQGIISHKAMIKAMIIMTGIILILGGGLILRAGLPILLVGIFGLLTCFWYTMGKRPLAYLGFSEIVVFVLFGPFSVLGTFYVQTLTFLKVALLASLTPGFLSAALLLTNNLRDLKEDTKSHKITLAVRCGESFSRKCIIAFIILASLGPIFLFLGGYSWVVLLSNLALLWPLSQARMILFEPISAKFNLMLARIGQALYLVAILLTLGLYA
jgi:1,4-dihydroxy-2-naphthoate octaprenyltransferase